MYPENFRYTKEHEWIDAGADGACAVGITEHAQGELGDVVFVQLPEVGKEYAADQSFGVVESVKAVSDIYMPVAAKVVEVNARLEENPELVNSDPHGEGWICKVEPADKGAVDALMSAGDYQGFVSA